jgi:hypothetical protein
VALHRLLRFCHLLPGIETGRIQSGGGGVSVQIQFSKAAATEEGTGGKLAFAELLALNEFGRRPRHFWE